MKGAMRSGKGECNDLNNMFAFSPSRFLLLWTIGGCLRERKKKYKVDALLTLEEEEMSFFLFFSFPFHHVVKESVFHFLTSASNTNFTLFFSYSTLSQGISIY